MEVLTASLWFNSDDPSEKDSAKSGIRRAIAEAARRMGMDHSPVEYRVYEVSEMEATPPIRFGPGTKCLVGEAKAKRLFHIAKPKSGFTHELETKDLEALRVETRRRLDQSFPHDRDRSNARVDAIINEIGPESAVAQLREGAAVH